MNTIYDIAGIGIGPFNLGLAALAQSRTKLKSIFFDQNDSFNWHPGMLLSGTKLQVPFHADLVTLADPRSPFSFLSFLQAKDSLFRFTIREVHYPFRKQYNAYCRWVADQLKNLRFNLRCLSISYDRGKNYYMIQVISSRTNRKKTYLARRIVIGVGTKPYMPECLEPGLKNAFHSENYLLNKSLLNNCNRITIIGSGQSAAEIFDDLISTGKYLYWITRSVRYFPLDYSKFSLEMTSPDYIDHFYSLTQKVKDNILALQSGLYKGINSELINTIYEKLYESSLDNPVNSKYHLNPNCRLVKAECDGSKILCSLEHNESGQRFQHSTDALIMATGYCYRTPTFLDPLKEYIFWDDQGRYSVRRNYSIDLNNTIFIQNGELHTHGFNAPDLGMGPYRNSIILNSILGKEVFRIEKNVPFQDFVGHFD